MLAMTAEDNEAIREVLYRYCQYVDEGNPEAWASLFVEDGSFDVGMGGEPCVGTEALRTFASVFRPGAGLHVTANPVITVDGDEATAQSTVFVIGDADGPSIGLAGRYDDRLRRDAGSWRLVTRRLDPKFRRAS